MKTFNLQASLRKETGKKESKNLRKQDLVPCVLYGGEKNIHFAVVEKAFKNLVYSPDVFLVKLDIDGEKIDAIMKDIQFHPVSDHIIHVDFSQVFTDKSVTVNLPILLTGSSLGMIEGGKLRQRRRYIKVKGLIEFIPDNLEVDITDLDIGDSLKVGDLDYDNLEVLDPSRAMVVGVVSSRLIAKGLRESVEEEEEAAEAAEAAEVAEGLEADATAEGGAPAEDEASKED
jgi:large subunit ribosomal protein L25